MRTKVCFGIISIFITTMLLLTNCQGVGSYGWEQENTLSNSPDHESEDPEIAGFSIHQTAVWEEYNGDDWDIHMSYTLTDGAVWIRATVDPATTDEDEKNPAVAVTRVRNSTNVEIHVVYELYNTTSFKWNIYHKYTTNLGNNWSCRTLLSTGNVNANNPACVYTEDQCYYGSEYGYSIQIVWQQQVGGMGQGANDYRIVYKSYSWDPTAGNGTFWWTASVLGIRTNPYTGYSCLDPEIASVDETSDSSNYSYPFAIVWEEQSPKIGGGILTSIYYIDGYFRVSTNVPSQILILTISLNTGTMGQVSRGSTTIDAYDPDIAATQDYELSETYYYHIVYDYRDTNNTVNYVESCLSYSGSTAPGAGDFFTNDLPYVDRVTSIVDYQNPTVTVRLNATEPAEFEVWIAWENNTVPSNAPDIYYRMGLYNGADFTWNVVPGRVGYNSSSNAEHNPEIWTRNEIDGPTSSCAKIHLVWDDIIPPSSVAEIKYIDP